MLTLCSFPKVDVNVDMGFRDTVTNLFTRQTGVVYKPGFKSINDLTTRLKQAFGSNPATPEVQSLIDSGGYLDENRMNEWLGVVAAYSAIRLRCESVSNTAMLIRGPDGNVIENSRYEVLLEDLRSRLFEIEFELLTAGVVRIYVNKVVGGSEFHIVKHTEYRSPDVFSDSVQRVRPGQRFNDARATLGYWRQSVNGIETDEIELTNQNTIEIKNKMPLSPLAAALRDIVTLRDMQDANSAAFKHAFWGSNIIFAVKGATDKQLENFSTGFREKHAGLKGVGRPAVIPGDSVDIKTSRPSNVDLQFIEGQKFEIEQIARAFGVSVILLQNIEASTYNNNIEARKDFYKTTIANEWNHISTEVVKGFKRVFGFPGTWRLGFDDTIIKALEPSFYDRADSILKIVSSGTLTINEIREELGLMKYEGSIGDAPLVLNTFYPLDAAEGERYPTGGSTTEEPEEPADDDDDETDDTEEQTNRGIVQRRGVVKKIDLAFAIEYAQRYNQRTRTFYEDIWEMMSPVRRKFLTEVRRSLNDNVRADTPPTLTQATISKATFIEPDYFKDQGENISQKNIEEFMMSRSEAAARMFKIPVFKDSDVVFKAYSEERAALWSDALGKRLGEALPRAFAEEVSRGGRSNPQLVREMLKRFNDLTRVEARRIVRTETNSAANYAHIRTYEAAGVEGKIWIAAGDDRTRPDHAEANGDVQKLDEPFIVGGEELEAPTVAQGGGPASTGNSINCRCTVGPIVVSR